METGFEGKVRNVILARLRDFSVRLEVLGKW